MPTREALDDAMRHPGRAVPAINRLGGGTVAQASGGRPLHAVGTTSVVYQLRQPSGRTLALRCPLAEPPDKTLPDRYRALANATVPLQLREAPPRPLVRVLGYLADGLALPAPDFRSAPRPLIALEWVAGPTLLAAVERACREYDRATLAALGDAWLAAIRAIGAVGFTHGDLTADNALVRPDGSIALVDYDTCSWVGGPRPAVAPPAPAYRHPSRKPGAERQDDFAALVILTSLRALAEWPELRNDHGEPADAANGALLFAARDLAEPDASPLFETLGTLTDPRARTLVDLLRQACRRPGDAVPPFRDIATGAATSRPQTAAPRQAQPPARAPIAPSPGTSAPARQIATSAPQAAAAASEREPERELDPRERQRRLTRLNSLLLAGEDAAARRYWQESGLADDPEAARELGRRLTEIERQRAARPSPAPPPVRDPLPPPPLPESTPRDPWLSTPSPAMPPVPPVPHTPPPVHQRVDDLYRLRTAVETGDAATAATLWPRVRHDPVASSLAIPVAELVSQAAGAAIARAVERGDDAETLEAIQEAERAGVAIAPRARKAARIAATRMAARRDLEDALAAGDRGRLAELAASGRLDALGKLPPEIARVVVQALAWPHLDRALAHDDDAAILAAFDDDLAADPGALTVAQQERVELARRRTEWLHAVRTALRRREAAALRVALHDVPPGAAERLSQVERGRIERLAARDEAVDRLETALRTGPDGAIVEALNQAMAAGAVLPDALDWTAVGGIVDRVSLVDAVRRAASAEPPDYERLARLLPAVRAAGQDDPGLARDLDLGALEARVLRAAHRARLLDALAWGEDYIIAAAAYPDPYDVLSTLAPEQRARVAEATGGRR